MVLEVNRENLGSSVNCLIGQSPSDPDVSVVEADDCHTSWTRWGY